MGSIQKIEDEENDKWVIHSRIFTAGKNDYSIYEMRIMIKIIHMLRSHLKGLKFKGDYAVTQDLWNDLYFTMPLVNLMSEEDKDNNLNSRIVKSLKNLMSKVIEYEDKQMKEIRLFHLLTDVSYNTKTHIVNFRVSNEMAKVYMSFSQGFSRYQLAVAMSLRSYYALRFYMLFANQEKPIDYGYEDKLRVMFNLKDKYKNINDFTKKILLTAQQELDEKSPVTFEFIPYKEGKKIKGWKFIPIKQPEKENFYLKNLEITQDVSLRWDLSRETLAYLKNAFFFEDKEINQHRELFKRAEQEFDLLIVLARIKRYAEGKPNPKGYVITSIQNELAKLEGKEKVTEQKTQAPPEPTAAASPAPADMIKNLAKSFNQNK